MSTSIHIGDTVRLSDYINGEPDEWNPDCAEGVVTNITQSTRFGNILHLDNHLDLFPSDYGQVSLIKLSPASRPGLVEALTATLAELDGLTVHELATALIEKGYHR